MRTLRLQLEQGDIGLGWGSRAVGHDPQQYNSNYTHYTLLATILTVKFSSLRRGELGSGGHYRPSPRISGQLVLFQIKERQHPGLICQGYLQQPAMPENGSGCSLVPSWKGCCAVKHNLYHIKPTLRSSIPTTRTATCSIVTAHSVP